MHMAHYLTTIDYFQHAFSLMKALAAGITGLSNSEVKARQQIRLSIESNMFDILFVIACHIM